MSATVMLVAITLVTIVLVKNNSCKNNAVAIMLVILCDYE